ncbi:hypothetical protein AAT19DRAFT_14575 [Rhodotorula toruloides]|uniref:Glycerol-3-phosphate dehydrogenase NAD-dependent C-terminal domain-containing protein n=1 Tax=Rhodotorula toruloides TaxID=5286 RepID=A0A2T0A871_RHOTO|nr:hypothetical protein AAT19DRAFT_14575 [Rhodotorula toruloides]
MLPFRPGHALSMSPCYRPPRQRSHSLPLALVPPFLLRFARQFRWASAQQIPTHCDRETRGYRCLSRLIKAGHSTSASRITKLYGDYRPPGLTCARQRDARCARFLLLLPEQLPTLSRRNSKCAEASVTSGKTFDKLEKELLNGQKLQGVATAEEIYTFLKARERLDGYPLFTKVYQICKRMIEPEAIFEGV